MKILVTPTRHELGVVDGPTPDPGPRDVRVRVLAGSVNPVDAMVREGTFHDLGLIAHDGPVGLGWDLVGVVDGVGDAVTPGTIHVGDLVAALHPGVDRPAGALAEQVVVPESAVALVPAGLDVERAAAVGMNALTASQAMALLGPADGRTLLVTGAAGGVGGFAVELATATGWEVTGLARGHDRDFVERTGARLATALETGETFDAVLDAAALQADAATFAATVVPALGEGAVLVSVLGAFPLPDLPEERTATSLFVEPDGPELGRLLDLTARGELTPRVAGVVSLEESEKAFTGMGSGGRGRWLVRPTAPTD